MKNLRVSIMNPVFVRRQLAPIQTLGKAFTTTSIRTRTLLSEQHSSISRIAPKPSWSYHTLKHDTKPALSRRYSSISSGNGLRSEQDDCIYTQSRLRISPFLDLPKQAETGPSAPLWDGRDLHFEDQATGQREVVSKRWLRDQCPCEKCVHPETRQRQMDTFQINPNITIESFVLAPGGEAATIQWQDGHESLYPIGLLRKRKPRAVEYQRRGIIERKLFDRTIAETPPTVDYEDVMNSSGVAEWTRQISTYGFSFVKGCPVDGPATKELLEKIGPIRETHYGGFYDFTSNMASKDTAYTTLSLGAHTDTTYFSEPAGLQMFHMLSHTGGSGGESLLVDGFAAATKLYNEDKEAYRILSTVRVWSHASGNEDVSIQPYTSFPVLSHDPVLGHLIMLRWNNDDRAGVEAEGEMVDKWYEAAGKFNSILNHPSMQYWTQLQPGVPLIFDNWRVLHGRSQFVGKRRMSGGYINRDDYVSRLKLSNMGRDGVLRSTVTG